ncbi:dTMP kinase [Candidatus Magnetominusculus dajiuhuensis]|uniref:dTMP kinase n=1 Tax=Candidatus Magnetominusculus dajiuhuensis TaxID=3137712 RepID=UPI003B429BB6
MEGIEGAGKTTQVRMVSERLRARGIDVVATFEPGGTEIGKRIREILLDKSLQQMSPLTELLLYNAARVQHMVEVISIALDRHTVVITDRFTDSTLAYQCYGRGLQERLIMDIDKIATGGIRPDMTVLLDLPPNIGLGRNKDANKTDRFEVEPLAFHEKVRAGFLELANSEPARFKVINATADTAVVTEEIVAAIEERLQCR